MYESVSKRGLHQQINCVKENKCNTVPVTPTGFMNLKSMTESPQCHHMVCGRQLCISNPCSASSSSSLCGSKPLSSILDRAEGLLGELGHLPHFPELQFVAVWLNKSE